MTKNNVKNKWVFIMLLALLSLLISTAAFAATSQMPPVTTGVGGAQVSGFSGGNSYSIPIVVPEGPGGMMPKLALTYNSVAIDEGQPTSLSRQVRLGKGWSISGLVSIQRDGWGETYNLVMAGSREKLIFCGDGYYHTEHESFSIIKKEGNYWWLKTKDGTYFRLGYNDNSRHYTKQYTSCGSYAVDFDWGVDLVQDIYGNQMTFTYEEYRPSTVSTVTIYTARLSSTYNNNHELMYKLSQVKYTLRNGSPVGQAITVDFGAGVSYVYSYGTDYQVDAYGVEHSYSYISSWANKSRYYTVSVKVNDTLVRKYDLAYDTDINSDFKLVRARVYGSDNTTLLPETRFTYDTGGRLTKVTNGTGGTREFTYGSYSLNNKTIYRVPSENSQDGMGNTYTTNYAYSGPVWADDEFRGHNYVKATDAIGTFTETWFHQDAIKEGLAYESQTKDAAGNLYKKSTSTYNYTTPYTGVNFVYLAQSDAYLYDGDATYKQTQTQYTYDGYGNLTKTSTLGDVSVTGDELYSYAEYINDTTNWILGVPKHAYTKKSDDATVVAESWNYYSETYNGAVDYGTSKKFLRKVETAAVFGDRGNANNPTVETSYDEWGNVIAVTDALGNTTTSAYDSIFHLFPVSATNAMGQTVHTYYYGINGNEDTGFTGSGLFGQVKSVKSINGHFVRNKYDVFGRPTATWRENFSEAYPEVSYTYTPWIDANSPNKVVQSNRKAAGNAETWDTSSYSDGMGRTLQTQSPSDEAGKMMISGPVEYNNLGQVYKTYVAYETTSSGAYIAAPTKEKPTQFTYDAIGRCIRADYADGTCTRTFYNDYVTTAVDKENKQVRTTVDVYGRAVKTETFTGSYPTETVYAMTIYEYDDLGRCTKTTDAQGNENTVTYDNLGRKTAMHDMDMGNWTYQYNILGQLVSQTDAKGQTITMEYDALGRLIRKNRPDGTWTKYWYDNYEGYDGSASLGKLVKTEEGRD